MSMEIYKINFLDVENTEKFTKGIQEFAEFKKFIGLGIYSELTAHLLESVIRYKWSKTRAGRFIKFITPTGGGMFVKANGFVAINCQGEVGIFFNRYEKIGKFPQIEHVPTEKIKYIKDKLANDLKEFWNYKAPNNEFEIIIESWNDNGERFDAKFNYNEFRTLYEFLKSRDIKKIKDKYGVANFKEMIGEKNEDQFVLMATETIMAEINKLVKEREAEAKRLEEEHHQNLIKIHKKQEAEREASKKFYNEKIKNLEEQMKMMKTAS